MTQDARFASLRGKSRKWMEAYLAEYEDGFDDGLDPYHDHKTFDFHDRHDQYDHVFDFGDEDDFDDQDDRWLHLYDGWGPIVPRRRVDRAPDRCSPDDG